MEEPVLDKIIGCSSLTKSKLSVHYETGATAFASHGFLSIVVPQKKQRYDFKIADDGREISALCFSVNDSSIVVGELGTNARLFIFTFNDKFDLIISKQEIKTKENGFSFLALNQKAGKLITVGNDENPFLLLWDLTQPRPACIGYYHLPTVPQHVIFSPDCNFAIVSGDKLLKAVDTSISYGSTPCILKTRNFNIGKYKTSTFVSSAVNARPPYNIYSLTDVGTLCIIDSTSVSFQPRKKVSNSTQRTLPPVLVTPINLNNGPTTCITLDRKIILVGTSNGSILAIKRDGDEHRIFGQFSADGKSVTAVGIAERMISAAYDDGSIICWQRKISSSPIISLPSHIGPVCQFCLAGDKSIVISGGSDGTVKEWRIQKNSGLVGKSSQELICTTSVTSKAADFLSQLSGVRCISSYGNYVFAGDNSGILHVLELSSLNELQRLIENKAGIFSMAVHPKMPLLATGGADGIIRLYNISTESSFTILSRIEMIPAHSTPIMDISFAGNSVISCSTDGVRFMTKELKKYATHHPDEPCLTLYPVPNEKFIVAGGCDHSVVILRVSNGTVFRRYKLSMSAYPLHLCVDRSGLFVAVAMSDGSVRILDIMSGDVITVFLSMAGMITGVSFHEDDILISSVSGCIMRWSLPSQIHNAITEKLTKDLPIMDLIEEETPMPANRRDMVTAGSMLNFSAAPKSHLFKPVEDQPMSNGQPVIGEELDATDGVNAAGFDAPRPSVVGSEESKVDSIVRASFIRQKQSEKEEKQENVETIEVDKLRASIKQNIKRKKSDDDPFIVTDSSPTNTSSPTVITAHKPQKKPKVEEIQQTIDQLGDVVTHVKELLAYKPQNYEEERAQNELRRMYTELQKECIKEEWFGQLMSSYLAKFFDFIKRE
ncbi:hypothetical protein TVAG_331900 [Trichomonas vaginalis G3]|uniref:Anaphase-promoting complex subunit 4-like WD40 domain-containing protein n=1 Tax=Trichomonas vaginalis (strain ATCC PRA-98 / G3) TaxID=412133 RepID=A2FYG5_TRIV3|nr:mitogen-activated protein family [Trichomonas vaginalis G3]EAX90052.1 hypothetical protein TVAG_331900 [Trichomonas vaginalis G3]KAI5540767.1 mitogen-activated protein family [Trichomonas vaginalis G3]|eukprot:XP_001302982.1 hypothetical protein [Trichomonas vaginalis G3]